MDIVNYYYNNIGVMPNDDEKNQTLKTINYLKDNNISIKEIIDIIDKIPYKKTLAPEDLPESLWHDSLIKRDMFYFHNEIHITSPAPYWNFKKNKIISEKFYLEMKIKYTIDDLIKYYYKAFPNNKEFEDNKKDIGAMQYLLNQYKKIDFIENVDFILFLIDTCSDMQTDCIEILDLKKCQNENYKFVSNKALNAKFESKNKIIWR